MKVTGIILAGGKSTRMGEDKGLILLNDIPMIEYLINVFSDLKIPVIIISNNEDYNQFNLPVYQDIEKEKGPAGGILSALTFSKTQKNIIVSCDTPFITVELINFLLDSHQNNQVTIPKYENRIHPLIGVYEKEVSKSFEESIRENQLRIRDILKKLDTKEVELPLSIIKNGHCLTNINTKQQLNQHKNED